MIRLPRALAAAIVAVPLALASPVQAATGDANADGRIDLADALVVCRFLSGAGGAPADPDAADADRDGDTDHADVELLMLAAVGQPLPTRTFSVAPGTLDFASVLVGASAELEVTLSSDGTLPLTVESFALDPAGPPDFTLVSPPAVPAVLGPAENLVVRVRYAPGEAGDDLGSLAFLTDAGSASVALVGLGISPRLGVSPLFVEFGDVPVGGSDTVDVTLSNPGTAPLSILSVALGPATSADFSIGAPGASLLGPGESTTFSVSYAPSGAGEDTGRVDVLTDGGAAEIGLAGRGTAPELDIVPDTLDFGARLVGSSSTLFFDARNVGTAPLEVSQIALSVETSPAFTLGTLPGLPFTILPGEAAALSITFAPVSSGPAAGRVVLETNGGAGELMLTGSGVRPEIALGPGTVDFGNVLVGGTGEITLRISNAGTADLSVASITLAPGTSADFAIASGGAAIILGPGEFHEVDLAYTPGEVGPDTGTLSIESDDPLTPMATVPLLGNGVASDFVLQPASLDFDSVRVGLFADRSFEILNSGSTSLSVLSVAVSQGGPVFSLSPPALPVDLAPAAALEIAVRFSPAAGGQSSGRVEVVTSAGVGEVPLVGVGTVPAIALSPEAVDFGQVPLAGTDDATVTVSNTGTAPLIVSGVAPLAGSAPDFSVFSTPALPATVSPQGSFDVVLRFSPSAAGAVTATVRFTSDDPLRPSVDLPLSGTGLGGAFLEVGPSSVDFGELSQGVTAQATLTLENLGDSALTVLSSGLTAGTSAEFAAAAPSDTTLAPDETATLVVSYTPADTGADAGALEIVSSANTVVVPLAGSGSATVTPVALLLDRTAEGLVAGDCLELHATAELSDGSFLDATDTVVWSSSAPELASVAPSGRVEALAAGDVVITATLGALTAQSVLAIAPAGSVRLVLDCGDVQTGTPVDATLVADVGPSALGAYAVRLVFDPALVVVSAVDGGAASGAFSGPPFSHPPQFTSGSVVLAAWQAESLTGPSGAVALAHVTFVVTGAAGASGRVGVEVIELVGTDLEDLPFTTSSSRVGVAP